MTLTLAAWNAWTLGAGLLGLVAGSTMLMVGGIWAGMRVGQEAMTGIWLGSFGTLVTVVGGLLLKWRFFGPLPPSLQPQEDA